MNIIRQLSFKSMKKNKTTTLVTILGIIMSIALMTGLFLLSNSLLNFMRDEHISRKGDAHLALYDVTREVYEQIPNRDLIEKETRVPLLGVVPNEGDGTPFYTVIGVNPEQEQSFPIQLDEGRLPEKPGEIVITNSVNKSRDEELKIGDRVKLDVKDIPRYDHDDGTYLDQGLVIEGTIVGIAQYSPLQYPHFRPLYMVYQSPDQVATANRLWVGVRINPLTPDSYERFQSGINQEIAPYMATELIEFSPNMPSKIRNYVYGFAMALAVIVGLAGIGLIQNGFLISLSQRMRELSVLSSIGMTRRQKWQMSLTEGLSLFVIGLPLGIAFGGLAMFILFRILGPILQRLMETNAVLKLTWDLPTIGLICLLSFVTLLVASFVPALKTSQQTPLSGVRQNDEFLAKTNSLKTPGFIRRLFGFEGELAWKNLRRNQRRYRGTLISLVFSLVLYLAFASVMHYADYSSKITQTRGMNDLIFYSRGVESFEKRDQFERLGAFEEIESRQFVYSIGLVSQQDQANVNSDLLFGEDINMLSVEVISFDDAQLNELYQQWGIKPEDMVGDKAVLINQYRQKVNNRLLEGRVFDKVPEQIEVNYYLADQKRNQTFEIVKAVDEGLLNYDSWGMAAKLVVSSETLENLAKKTDFVQMTLTMISKDRDHSELLKKIVALADESNIRLDITDFGDQNQRNQDFLVVSKILFFGFATIIGLISLANIYNSLISSLRFRRKEFAMLRSVGMEEKSFRKMIRFESYFYALKLLVYGLPIGVGLSYLIYRYLIQQVEFGFRIPVVHFGAAALVVVTVLILIMNLGSREARRGNILETLKLDMDL